MSRLNLGYSNKMKAGRYKRAAFPGFCWCLALFLTFFSVDLCMGETPRHPASFALVVSQKIRPYLKVVDGICFETGQAAHDLDVFLDPHPDQKEFLATALAEGGHDVVVAIGPEAAELVWALPLRAQKIYAAVLDPHTLKGLGPDDCGISLRIPVDVQLEKIVKAFPSIRRIGLLFDPANNAWFFDRASAGGAALGVEIVSLAVNDRTQISGILRNSSKDIDAVWMIPDQSIISEKIIHYVIRQGLYNRMGVIGYNSFFTRSGALISFEFDYEALGKQVGRKIMEYGTTGLCRPAFPVFNTRINPKIAGKIGMEVEK